eukprot:m.103258 g.103258  ORF g.103258 m.103258 type:complete len:520 (-) comp13234_c0_seq1:7704-9263(-)
MCSRSMLFSRGDAHTRALSVYLLAMRCVLGIVVIAAVLCRANRLALADANQQNRQCDDVSGMCTTVSSVAEAQQKQQLEHQEWIADVQDSMFEAGADLDSWARIGETKTKLQTVYVIQSPDKSDTCLIIDDVVQICKSYEAAYHEMFIHFPATYLTTLEYVLIIGGGDGMAMHEALKYSSVKKVVHLELDPDVPAAIEKHFGLPMHLTGNDRVEWIFGDAGNTLHDLVKRPERFDLVVMDVSETVSSDTIVTEDFVALAASVMRPEGVFIKNEDYQKLLSSMFPNFLETQFELPMIRAQTFCMGSMRTVFASPNFGLMRNQHIPTTFYTPLQTPEQHQRFVRHFHQQLPIDTKLFGLPYREYFIDAMTNADKKRYTMPRYFVKHIEHVPLSKHQGQLLIAELYGVPSVSIVEDPERLRLTLTHALQAGGFPVYENTPDLMHITVTEEPDQKRQSYTATLSLHKSTFSLHTHSDHLASHIGIEVYTSLPNADPIAVIDMLESVFETKRKAVTRIPRGLPR